ncbi:hypothetical protein ACQ3I4_02145 [Zafaria sp. Z1313]|uniref:hypothetical protein n=1 Tax=unclassified Zafaria TaxID=2828765 RepID=UPI002E77AB67|nr:hypothetical protein [Zafaria sp. J156]MEE1620174.1 hypothetical protein [Zafaria sp. J156]
MLPDGWMAVTRPGDRETVGYLEPLDPGYERVQARSLLGHAVGVPADLATAEELLVERGIVEVGATWLLLDEDGDVAGHVAVLEVSTDGIAVADALATKALAPTPRTLLAWPDTDRRLRPS